MFKTILNSAATAGSSFAKALAISQAASDAAMQSALRARGVIPPEEMTPAAFERTMGERLQRYGEVVRAAKITAE